VARKKFNPVYDETADVRYKAYPTAREFHRCSSFVRGLMGPVGAGKTVACIMELYSRAIEQAPYHGVRRTRWLLIRETYPELLTTTLKTFERWVSPAICPVSRGAVISGTLNAGLPDGTHVEAEFIFLALDSIDDIQSKLRSFEFTGAFINEASQVREEVLEMLTQRVGRFPESDADDAEVPGPTWHGVIMDTNPPADNHWWYRLAEVERPPGYSFFRQPPALIKVPGKTPKEPPTYVHNDGTYPGLLMAENIQHLPGADASNPHGGFDYYDTMILGKSAEWIKVFVLGEYGSLAVGRPVYSEYSDVVHMAKEELKPYRGIPVLLSWDFGLTPACILMQQTPRGQLRVLDELVSEDMGIERFSRDVVKPFLMTEKYQGCSFCGVGDPAGGQRSQTDETTCFHILNYQGLPTDPAPSNSFQIRREAVVWFMTKMVDGEPGFLMSLTCQILRKGFLSGYHYRRLKVKVYGGSDRYTETPEKNEFSHPHDALQYGCSHMRSNSLEASVDSGFGGPNLRREISTGSSGGWT